MLNQLLWISDEQVASTLTCEMAFDAVKRGLVAHADGLFVMPPKIYTRPGGREREFEQGRHIAMPAWVGGSVNAVGLKWISSVPINVERGLPRASGLVVLNDVVTGVPVSVMDCATLSARRTGAVAAIAWDYLGMAYDTVAIVGCGPINREVVMALNAVNKPIRQFRVFDLDPVRADHFCRSMIGRLKCEICVSPSLIACLAGATAVVTATTGAKGYIEAEWVKDARLIIPLSLDDFQAETLLSADKIIVDDFEQCAREEKLFHHVVRDGRLSRDGIYAQLGEIVAGYKTGRTGEETIYVNCMGLAVEDIAVAKAVYDRVNAG